MMSKFPLPILAAILALSGCVMIPNYERPAAPEDPQDQGQDQEGNANDGDNAFDVHLTSRPQP